MRRRALILRIDGGIATVRCPVEVCAACTSDSCVPAERETRAAVPQSLVVRVDDWVEVSYSTYHAIVDAVVVLGVPALGFAIAYLAAPALGSLGGTSAALREPMRVLFGFVGLAVGVLVPYLRRRLSPDSGLPIVTRVLRRKPGRSPTPDRMLRQPGP